MSFAVGTLVNARGREWVVMPDSTENLLVVRPLGGTDEEVTGLWLPLEKDDISPASFMLPDPELVGDYRSCRLLRDAVRLSSRAGAGPFRSFARIAVEPRPYQLVPLLMALRMDPIRMLISDDVGIGKTIEACLIARELLDRGEIQRIAVLCPPHLAEQWQGELYNKFHIEAELVLASTAARLERNCRMGQSLFDLYPHVIVSLDLIKSDTRLDEFVRTCPEMTIVDESHTCTQGYEHGKKQLRFRLISRLAENPSRHMIFVTATPHSGKPESFRSLLSFLNKDFYSIPDDLSGEANRPMRQRIAAQFVQRRRADIRHFMDTDTPFPERQEAEETYDLGSDYRSFFDKVIAFCRETISEAGGNRFRQRIRWWSALALLRSVGSSPAAAAETLRNRTPTAEATTNEEADQIGMRAVFDTESDDVTEGLDVAPGSDSTTETDSDSDRLRKRLLEMARVAEKLKGDKDAKLLRAVDLVKQFLKDNFRPIIFCRYIPTAEYLAEELRQRLRGVTVAAITGNLSPSEREIKIAELAESGSNYVLVCTDCLSEGINLQKQFDAVMHYDLSWSPTRHEQREGRVDRFGQETKIVRIMTYYGKNNPVDGIVLEVLLRKHKTIRRSLGYAVPVPVNTDLLMNAIFEGIVLRDKTRGADQLMLDFGDFIRPEQQKLHIEWDNATEKEKRSRTVFAQESIKPDEVAAELKETIAAIGSSADVKNFTVTGVKSHGGVANQRGGSWDFDIRELPTALRDMLNAPDTLKARFDLPVPKGTHYLSRTHPFVESFASYILDTALDPLTQSVARRAGAVRSKAVTTRTTLIIVRCRYDIITVGRGIEEQRQLAEECRILAFEGAPSAAKWLDDITAENILLLEPDANIASASEFVRPIVEGYDALRMHIDEYAKARGNKLLDAHRRVRSALKAKHQQVKVEPKLPPDIIGVFVYLPVTGGATQ